MKLLLIEDSRDICLALSKALATLHDMDIAMTGQLGLTHAATNQYDVIVLDLGLPDINGQEVCRKIRDFDHRTPILILSGETKVLTKIAVMDIGADDYLTKPFSLGELKVRLRALERRSSLHPVRGSRLTVTDLSLDSNTHTVIRNGHEIKLRKKEFALLECLMHNAGSVVSRQMLSNYAWHDGQETWTNTVDVHIKYLRDKMDRPFEAQLIKTVHGLGYKLESKSLVAEIAA